jgi:hypothetical protein
VNILPPMRSRAFEHDDRNPGIVQCAGRRDACCACADHDHIDLLPRNFRVSGHHHPS